MPSPLRVLDHCEENEPEREHIDGECVGFLLEDFGSEEARCSRHGREERRRC